MPTLDDVRTKLEHRLDRVNGDIRRCTNALDLMNRGLDPQQIHMRLGWTPASKTSLRRALIRYSATNEALHFCLNAIDGRPDKPETDPEE